MSAAEPSSAVIHLLAWLSPAFPVGAFAYSHGLEAAVESGDITDAATLQNWLADLVSHGSGRNDAIFASAAWSAAVAADATTLREVNNTALALSPARERRLETSAMGSAFAATIRSSWDGAACLLLPERDIAYPVAFGASCAMKALPLGACLEAYCLAFVQNLISAAVRLGPVGQTDGQKIMAASVPAVERMAAFAASATLDDLGGCTLRSDIAAMRHETLYSRLFRS